MPMVCPAVIALTRRPPAELNLLYIGTASYDMHENRMRQTSEFARMGVSVRSLDVANRFAHEDELIDAVYGADIILVSGGNTLYAVDRWHRLGLADLLRDAAHRGTVIAGGSAGAICWFDGGHSDSMDPMTHRAYKLNNGGRSREEYDDNPIESMARMEGEETVISNPSHVDCGRGAAATGHEGNGGDDATRRPNLKRIVSSEETIMDNDAESDMETIMDEDIGDAAGDWEYIRVGGLGIFPGLICPHHDCIQSNGVLRSADFKSMMARHPHEIGIGIDNFAALVFDGRDFRVLSMPGVASPRIKHEVGKIPGVWINYVDDDGVVHSKRCPRAGKVADLLQMLRDPAVHLGRDERVDLCRRKNPQLEGISKM
jgi:dipeptidase E